MIKKQWLTLLQGFQLIIFYITINYFITSTSKYFIPQYIALMILFAFLSRKKAFVLLITYGLITGIGYLLLGLIGNYNSFDQWRAILLHLALIINATVLYSVAFLGKSLQDENLKLKERVEELEVYIGASGLLTKSEYIKRSKLIKKAMERRNEEGYQIYFSFNRIDEYVRVSTFSTLTKLAVSVFRSEYDLVGKWDDYTFVVLLQNTHEAGMKIALERYFQQVKSKMNIYDGDIGIKIEAIEWKSRKESA